MVKPLNGATEEDKDGDGGGDGGRRHRCRRGEASEEVGGVSRGSMVKEEYPTLPKRNADDSDMRGSAYDKAIVPLIEKGEASYADTCNDGTHPSTPLPVTPSEALFVTQTL